MSSVLRPTRLNKFPNPRCVAGGTTSVFGSRFGWTRTFGTGDINAPVGSYVRYTCPTSQTGPSRGVDLFGNLDLATPPGGGLAVTAGTPLSVSIAVRSTGGVLFTVAARFADASGAWVSSVVGAPTASGTIGIQWVSVSTIVPAGAVEAYIQVRNATSIAWSTGDTIDLAGILIETAASNGPYFDGTSTYDKPAHPSWLGTAHASPSILSDATASVTVTDGTTTVGAVEIVACSLRRPLRRTVQEPAAAEALITAGTPGLLSGQITYLCASLARALALDALYKATAPLTLRTGGEMDGLKHQAVETPQLVAERAVNGSPSRWLYTVEIRERA